MRIVLAVILSTLLGLPVCAQEVSEKPRVALVLAGGAAKGFVHIGVMKVLEEENIPFDLVVGTSIGSVVGSMVSLGYSAAEIEAIAREQAWEALFSDVTERKFRSAHERELGDRYLLTFPVKENETILKIPLGMLRGQNVLNEFAGITAGYGDEINFLDLPVPFISVASDLESGEVVPISKGNLKEAVLASMCVPGIFAPVDYDGRALVDGGIVHNLPVSIARDHGAQVIIGVDLRKENKTKEELKTFGDVFWQLFNIVGEEDNVRARADCDILILPDLTGYSSTNFDVEAIDTLIRRGEEAARLHLDELRKLKELPGRKVEARTRGFEPKPRREKWKISEISIPPHFDYQSDFILNRLGLKTGGEYALSEIKDGINRLYANGDYEKVSYTLSSSGQDTTAYRMKLEIEGRSHASFHAGFSLNTVDAAQVYLGYCYFNRERTFSLFSADAKIAINPALQVKVESYSLKNLPVFGFEVFGNFTQSNTYVNFERADKLDLYTGAAKFYVYKQIEQVFSIGLDLGGVYYEPIAGDNLSNQMGFEGEKLEDFFARSSVFFKLDDLDDKYIPNRGREFLLSFEGYTSDFELEDHLFAVNLRYRTVWSLAQRWSALYSVNGRWVKGEEIPLPLKNYSSLGYRSFSDTYIPLFGQRGLGFIGDIACQMRMGFRHKLGSTQYISLSGEVLGTDSDVLFTDEPQWVFGLGLDYDRSTILGPLRVHVGVNTKLDGLSIYGGLGFHF